ncbi:hypothetical protein [Pollutibacter soli]|uniref:hypothetical protein n=1 Tax=Pollutibacter soli TaxID=3034157 RepID=UPI0030140DA7
MKASIGFLVFLLLFFSCRKEDLQSASGNPAIIKIPSKVTSFKQDGKIILRQVTFSYDQHNRCIEILEKLNLSDIDNGALKTISRCVFFYNGDELLPYRMYQDGDENVGTTSDVYFSYNTEGRKSGDSIIYTIGSAGAKYLKMAEYKYAKDLLYFRRSQISISGDPFYVPLNFNDTAYFSGENVTRFHVDKIYFLGKSTFEYDTKINPFRYLNISEAYLKIGPDLLEKWPFIFDFGNMNVLGYSRNNILKFNSYLGSRANLEFTFTYDNDGYPATAKARLGANNYISDIIYEYW